VQRFSPSSNARGDSLTDLPEQVLLGKVTKNISSHVGLGKIAIFRCLEEAGLRCSSTN
jgi:hypothetical protein